MKRINRGLSSVGILSLAIVALLFLAVPTTVAQEVTEASEAVSQAVAVSATNSTATIQVNGTASALRTGLGEAVTFSGKVAITATVVTDPALPTSVTLYIDGKGVKGVGNETGTVYVNSCEAILTRLFRPTDEITLTFAFFEDKPGSHLKSKTGVFRMNLTYDQATLKLSGATGVAGSL